MCLGVLCPNVWQNIGLAYDATFVVRQGTGVTPCNECHDALMVSCALMGFMAWATIQRMRCMHVCPSMLHDEETRSSWLFKVHFDGVVCTPK